LKDRSRWLSGLIGRESDPIYKINLPGTHDSGAISSVLSPWACQAESITTQLLQGVRLLDMRLRLEQNLSHGIELWTCHGNFGPDLIRNAWPYNRYEPLSDAIKEMTDFLGSHGGEFLVVSFKIDDFGVFSDTTSVRDQVAGIIINLLGSKRYAPYNRTPLVSGCRDLIYVLDRVHAPTEIGLPLSIRYNRSQQVQMPSQHQPTSVWVQDVFKNLGWDAEDAKLTYVFDAISNATNYNVSINFASATQFEVFGVSSNARFMYQLLGMKPLPTRLGWMLFDYALAGFQFMDGTTHNCVDLVIASNESPPYSSFSAKVMWKGWGSYP